MTKETQLKGQIKDYLRLKHKFWWYNLQGIGAQRGVPDLMVMDKGILYGIEVKAPKGYLSDYQKEFAENLRNHGGVFIEARSLDDVMESIF